MNVSAETVLPLPIKPKLTNFWWASPSLWDRPGVHYWSLRKSKHFRVIPVPEKGTMRTWLRKMVGITGQPRPTNLDAAMLRIAQNIRPVDSFCVTENNWRHRDAMVPKEFQVSIFYAPLSLVQKEGNVLNEVIDAALADYKLKI